MRRSALTVVVVTTSLIIGVAAATPVFAATRGSSGAALRSVPWQTKVERACTKASHRFDDVYAGMPEVLASGERVTFRELSASERFETVAFFSALGLATQRFARQLDAITPDKSSAKSYSKLVGALAAESIAYRHAANKIGALQKGQSDKGAIGDELGVAAVAEQLASDLAGSLDLTCEAVVVSDEPATPAPGSTTCFSGTDPADAVEVPCTEGHDAELFISIDGVWPADAPFPETDAGFALAEERCTPEFEKFVGIPVEESQNVLGFVLPAEPQWAQGNRSVDCYVLAYPEGSTLVGSAAGTKQ